MHIPDAFLPISHGFVYWIVALVFIALSLRWARSELDDDRIPLVAVLAAGIFAIQAMNIPIPWGTSGHMVGAALAAIVLGSPYAAVFILTIVLLVQGFLFADGGITAMGANILNMGVIGGFVGYYSFRGISSAIGSPTPAYFIAGWLSLFAGAVVCALEMAAAGTFPLELGLASMGTYHAVIGLIEGAITTVAIALIAVVRPDIMTEKRGVAA